MGLSTTKTRACSCIVAVIRSFPRKAASTLRGVEPATYIYQADKGKNHSTSRKQAGENKHTQRPHSLSPLACALDRAYFIYGRGRCSVGGSILSKPAGHIEGCDSKPFAFD